MCTTGYLTGQWVQPVGTVQYRTQPEAPSFFGGGHFKTAIRRWVDTSRYSSRAAKGCSKSAQLKVVDNRDIEDVVEKIKK